MKLIYLKNEVSLTADQKCYISYYTHGKLIIRDIQKRITYLVACVGVFAADFLPSIEAKCCSNASNKLLGAWKYINYKNVFVKYLISINDNKIKVL